MLRDNDIKLLLELCLVDQERCRQLKRRIVRDFRGGGDIAVGIAVRERHVTEIEARLLAMQSDVGVGDGPA